MNSFERQGPMALCLLALGVTISPTAMAQIAPNNAIELTQGSEVVYHRAAADLEDEGRGVEPVGGPFVRVWTAFVGDAPDLSYQDCGFSPLDGMTCDDALISVALSSSAPSALSDASAIAENDLLADPWSGTIYRATFAEDGVTLNQITNTLPDGSQLRQPVAVEHAGAFVFFVEGLTRSGADQCGCVADQPGALHAKSAARQETFQDWGVNEGQLPVSSTKATFLKHSVSPVESLLYVVTGSPTRVVVYDVTDFVTDGPAQTDRFVRNFPIPETWACDGSTGTIGEPSSLAVLDDGRVVVGSRHALVVLSEEGNFLGSIWTPDESPGLEAAAELVSIDVSGTGDHLFAVFSTESMTFPDNTGPAILARWSSDRLSQAMERDPIVVDPSGDGDYLRIQEAIEHACSGDEIIIAEGEYPEALVIHGESLVLKAKEEKHFGRIIVDAGGEGSALAITRVGSPGVAVEGLVLRNGNGNEVTTDDGEGGLLTLRTGGGLFVFEATATVNNTFIRGNNADVGGGLAAVAHRGLTLDSVAIDHNEARELGGGVAIVGAGLYPRQYFDADHITMTRNNVDLEIPGSTAMLSSTDVFMTSSIIDDLRPSGSLYIEDIEGGCVEFSTLRPAADWEALDFSHCANIENLFDDPLFVDADEPDEPDLHLRTEPEVSPAIGAGVDGTDQGVYGGSSGDWYPQDGDDDDDDTTDDDDDDATRDDDDTADDDDGGEVPIPSGLRCSDCNVSVATGSGWPPIVAFTLIVAWRRRQRGAAA